MTPEPLSIPEMLAVIQDAGAEIERLRAERADLLAALKALEAATIRYGIQADPERHVSDDEWVTGLNALFDAIKSARLVMARADASALSVGTARKQGDSR